MSGMLGDADIRSNHDIGIDPHGFVETFIDHLIASCLTPSNLRRNSGR
jgi:hypothetical protein